MGIFGTLRRWLFRLFKKKSLKIGLYGAPNAGKTTLANRISMDWTKEAMGLTSPIPHETNEVIQKRVVISLGKKKNNFDIFDTPGVAGTAIEYKVQWRGRTDATGWNYCNRQSAGYSASHYGAGISTISLWEIKA